MNSKTPSGFIFELSLLCLCSAINHFQLNCRNVQAELLQVYISGTCGWILLILLLLLDIGLKFNAVLS